MAVIEISKIRLVGLKSESAVILDTLSNTQMFEVIPAADVLPDTARLDAIEYKRAKLSFGIKYLNECAIEANRLSKTEQPEGYVKFKPSDARTLIKTSDFIECGNSESELLPMIDELEQISFRRTELKAELSRVNAEIKSLKPYLNCPFEFAALHDYTRISVFAAAAGAGAKTVDISGFDAVVEHFDAGKSKCVTVIALTEDVGKIKGLFTEAGYVLSAFNDKRTAREWIEDNEKKAQGLREELTATLLSALEYRKYQLSLKALYDFLAFEADKAHAEAQSAGTAQTFTLEGYVPKERQKEVEEFVTTQTQNVIIEHETLTENDNPPTLLHNKKLIQPFETITNMYSPPSYYEKDPNFIMAIFYFLIFGMMIADAGYGLLLSVAGILIVRLTKMERGVKQFMSMLAICGVSAIIWGVLFGGYFALDNALIGVDPPPLWFNPMNNPTLMLIVCLAVGVVHLSAGYGVKAYYLVKQGKPISAIFDVGFIYLLFIGVALFALSLLDGMPKAVSTVGIVLLLTAVAGIFLTSGRNGKGIFKKIMGGFAGLYGLINLFSDVLSYARIFGLALASAAIGMAFNTIVAMLFGAGPIGYIFGAVLLIVMHIFNLALGVLSAYVHNARLQFLEFYGKFYTGEGRLFKPLGGKTKYVRFE